MNGERKHHTPEEKVTILRRHLIDRVPVSTLCDEHQVHPTVFYRWLKQFFENGAAAANHETRLCHHQPHLTGRTADRVLNLIHVEQRAGRHTRT